MVFRVAIALLSLLLSGCSLFQPATTQRTELVFGTFCTATIFQRNAGSALDSLFEEMHRLDGIMSVHNETSAVSLVNRRAGGEPTEVPRELYEVLERGVAFGQITGGAFDISIGPLVELWNIGGKDPHIPSQNAIDQALELVAYPDILLLKYHRQVLLKRRGMRIDLGGIAKGYATDRAVELLRSLSIESALIDFGGNIYAVGEKHDGNPWRIGVQNPNEPRGNYLGILTVRNVSVVTSGVYERFFEVDGKRYHHILDTRTGWPVSNGLTSVTIIAESSMTADALATSVFALGINEGLTLIENFDGVEAILVTSGDTIYLSSGAGAKFTLTDDTFRVVSYLEGE